MCAQQPNEECHNPDGTPFVISGYKAFHSARIEAAAAESRESGREVTNQQFEALVNESGLV